MRKFLAAELGRLKAQLGFWTATELKRSVEESGRLLVAEGRLSLTVVLDPFFVAAMLDWQRHSDMLASVIVYVFQGREVAVMFKVAERALDVP
jgi:hypothetical protein